jgi:hypothetical protein
VPLPSVKSRLVLVLLAAVITSVFFLDFCNLVYSCGCRSWWSGADAHCNIHHPGVRHCPLCAIGMAGSGAVWAVIVAAQALVAVRWRGGWTARVATTLAVFPVVGGVIAVALGLARGYWTSKVLTIG